MDHRIKSKLSAIIILCATAIMIAGMDIFLPALPYLRSLFQTTELMMQFSLTLYSIVAALTGFVFGRFSDIYGRRPVMLVSFVFLILGSLLCAQAWSIESFIGFRFIQSFGASGIGVVGIAMLSDLFKGVAFARYMAIFGILYPVTYAIAPNIGAYFLEHSHWSWSFYCIAFLCMVFLLIFYLGVQESRPASKSKDPGFFKGLSDFQYILKDQFFLIMCLIHALPVTLSVVYLSHAPFIFIDILGLSPSHFALLNLIPVGVNIITTLSYRYILPKIGLLRALQLGSCVTLIFVTTTLIFMTTVSLYHISVILGLISIQNLGLVWCIVTAGTLATEASGQNKGLGIAFISFTRNSMMAFGVLSSGLFYNKTITPTFIYLIILSLTLFALAQYGLKLYVKRPNQAVNLH